jgi:hypothetical protein
MLKMLFEWALVLGLREPKGPPCALQENKKMLFFF